MARDSKLWEEAYKAYKKPQTKKRGKKSRSLEQQAKEIDREIAYLQKKRASLTRRIKEKNKNKTGRNWHLYAVRLEDDCWYIGIAKDPQKRFEKHKTHKGAMWCQKHKPIELVETRPTNTNVESEASLMENDMTFEYAEKYGTHLVRGGGYCQMSPRWPKELRSSKVVIEEYEDDMAYKLNQMF